MQITMFCTNTTNLNEQNMIIQKYIDKLKVNLGVKCMCIYFKY